MEDIDISSPHWAQTSIQHLVHIISMWKQCWFNQCVGHLYSCFSNWLSFFLQWYMFNGIITKCIPYKAVIGAIQ